MDANRHQNTEKLIQAVRQGRSEQQEIDGWTVSVSVIRNPPSERDLYMLYITPPGAFRFNYMYSNSALKGTMIRLLKDLQEGSRHIKLLSDGSGTGALMKNYDYQGNK